MIKMVASHTNCVWHIHQAIDHPLGELWTATLYDPEGEEINVLGISAFDEAGVVNHLRTFGWTVLEDDKESYYEMSVTISDITDRTYDISQVFADEFAEYYIEKGLGYWRRHQEISIRVWRVCNEDAAVIFMECAKKIQEDFELDDVEIVAKKVDMFKATFGTKGGEFLEFIRGIS